MCVTPGECGPALAPDDISGRGGGGGGMTVDGCCGTSPVRFRMRPRAPLGPAGCGGEGRADAPGMAGRPGIAARRGGLADIVEPAGAPEGAYAARASAAAPSARTVGLPTRGARHRTQRAAPAGAAAAP